MLGKKNVSQMVEELRNSFSREAIAREFLLQEGGITNPIETLDKFGVAYADEAKKLYEPIAAKFVAELEAYATAKRHYCPAVVKTIHDMQHEPLTLEKLQFYMDRVKEHIDEDTAKGHFVTKEELAREGLLDIDEIDRRAGLRGDGLGNIIGAILSQMAGQSDDNEQRFGTLPPRPMIRRISLDNEGEGDDDVEVDEDKFRKLLGGLNLDNLQ